MTVSTSIRLSSNQYLLWISSDYHRFREFRIVLMQLIQSTLRQVQEIPRDELALLLVPGITPGIMLNTGPWSVARHLIHDLTHDLLPINVYHMMGHHLLPTQYAFNRLRNTVMPLLLAQLLLETALALHRHVRMTLRPPRLGLPLAIPHLRVSLQQDAPSFMSLYGELPLIVATR